MDLNLFSAYILIAFTTAGIISILTLSGRVNKKLALIHITISSWTGLITFNHLYSFFPPDLTIFIDWIITTPLLIYALTETVAEKFSRKTEIGLMTLQIIMILTGLISFTQSSPIAFFLGTLLFSIITVTIYSKSGKHRKPVLVFFTAWTGYPLIFYTGIINSNITTETALLLTYTLAFFTKQVFALIDLLILDK